jgi:hypothetical protein
MLTKKDAIAVGKAICDAARRVSETSAESERNLVHMGRGTCIYAMDNLWYDVFPPKVRDYFGLNKDAFYEACGWPQ